MKSINFNLWFSSISGGIRVVFEIANRLAKRNYKVQLTSLGGDHNWFPLQVPISYVRPSGILKIADPYFKMRWGHPAHYYDVQHLINKFHLGIDLDFNRAFTAAMPDCDINIATWYHTAFPTWFSNKGSPFYLMQDFYEQMGNAYEQRIFQSTLRLPMSFISDSTFLEGLVIDQQPKAKVKLAPLGIDHETFHPARKKSIVDGCPVIMAILRGGYYKGSDLIIESLNAVHSVTPIHACLVTNAEILGSVKGKIKFPYTPYFSIPDSSLAALYSSSDLFLFTSRVEGFGLPPLEAMACGTPVVTTACRGKRDYAKNNENCIMCDPNNVASIRDALLLMLRDDSLRTSLVAGGLQTANACTWNETINAFEAAFKEAVG